MKEIKWVSDLKKKFQVISPHTGIGDDCAVLRGAFKKTDSVLLSKDLLLEGIHFLRESPNSDYLLGKKSVAVNLSDIAAMGGRARYLLIGLAVPRKTTDSEIQQFYKGVTAQCKKFSLELLGGDLSRSPSGWFISVTIMGDHSGKAILRKNVCLEDDLWVTGNLGNSHLGLLSILKKIQVPSSVLKAHLDPEPRLHWGRLLAQSSLVHSMMDLSDGLLNDLDNLSRSSGLGFQVYLDEIPHRKNYKKICHLLNENPVKSILSGGEDYELLFTAPKGPKFLEYLQKNSITATKIGKVAGKGVNILDSQGKKVKYPLPKHHF